MENLPVLRFVGIDVSLTETGIAIYTPCDGRISLSSSPSKRNEDIWDKQIRAIEYLYKVLRPLDVCCFESFGMVGRATHATGRYIERMEFSGMLKATAMLKTGLKSFSVHPKTLKRFIASDGNADKSKVLAALASRWGVVTTNNNMGDAAGLAIAAAFVVYGGTKELLIDWKPVTLTPAERKAINVIFNFEENRHVYEHLMLALNQQQGQATNDRRVS